MSATPNASLHPGADDQPSYPFRLKRLHLLSTIAVALMFTSCAAPQPTGGLRVSQETGVPVFSWDGGPISRLEVVRDEIEVWHIVCGENERCIDSPLLFGDTPSEAEEVVPAPDELPAGTYWWQVTAEYEDGSQWGDSSGFELAEPVAIDDAAAPTAEHPILWLLERVASAGEG